MKIPDSPLFAKTHDLIFWLLQRTQRFPKHLRHSYTNRLESLAFEFEEALVMANQHRGRERIEWLNRADAHLVCLRTMLRYSYDLGLLGNSQIRFVADRHWRFPTDGYDYLRFRVAAVQSRK